MRKIFHGLAAGSLLLLLFMGMPFRLYSDQNRRRASISFSLGYFQPKEDVFKEIYGNNKLQLNLNMRYALIRNISLYSGLRYISCKGETKTVGPEFQEEKYELSFVMYSIPFALLFSSSHRSIHVFLGGGASYNIYKEEWGEFDISFKDEKLGLLLIAGVEYFISNRFSLLAKAQYSSIPTKQGVKLAENINLGGTEVSLGFSFHL